MTWDEDLPLPRSQAPHFRVIHCETITSSLSGSWRMCSEPGSLKSHLCPRASPGLPAGWYLHTRAQVEKPEQCLAYSRCYGTGDILIMTLLFLIFFCLITVYLSLCHVHSRLALAGIMNANWWCRSPRPWDLLTVVLSAALLKARRRSGHVSWKHVKGGTSLLNTEVYEKVGRDLSAVNVGRNYCR